MNSSTVSVPISTRPLRLLSACRSLAAGDHVAGTPYTVQSSLCAGGMGQLYEVTHSTLGRRAVLKVLHERHFARSDYASRLQREARILAHLSGRRTPVVHDLGTLGDGRPYFVMERLDGADLRTELSRHGVLSVPSAMRVTTELLFALAEVHDHGVVHRDVKLENVFLCEDGRVVLLDFGVSQHDGDALHETGPGVALGTPRSMAPEQISCADADARSDVYAAGLVLYELCTGEGPFDDVGATLHGLRLAHCNHRPPRPSRRSPQPVPDAIEAIIARALSKEPARRFASAREMARAIQAVGRYPFDRDDEPTLVDD